MSAFNIEDPSETSDLGLPAVPSYLIGADNHQLGSTGTSILDPESWGDTATKVFQASVAVTTRAVTSVANSAISVGELVGVAEKSDEISTKQVLQDMDDDLGKYYTRNQSGIDVAGDVIAMFAPGRAGIELLNVAQKAVALASEGRAGLNMAANFGTLASKQAMYAEKAAAEIANGTPYNLINANLAKSLGYGYAQSALELAAFNTAAAVTMHSSPLFEKEDALDITYNSLLGGGFIGGGIMGTAIAVKTISAYRKAGNSFEESLNAYRTARTVPADSTPASERLAIHLNNIEALPTVAADDALASAKLKSLATLKQEEQNKGRLATHELVGSDASLGNLTYDVVSLADAESASQVLAGATKISRAGILTREEETIDKLVDTSPHVQELEKFKEKLLKTSVGTSLYESLSSKIAAKEAKLGEIISANQEKARGTLGVRYISYFGSDAGKITEAPNTLTLADKIAGTEDDVLARVESYRHKQGTNWSVMSTTDADAIEARYIAAITGKFNPGIAIGERDIPYLERGYMEMAKNGLEKITLQDGSTLDKYGLFHYLVELKAQEAKHLAEYSEIAGEFGTKKTAISYTLEDIAKLTNVSPEYLRLGTHSADNPAADILAKQTIAENHTARMIEQGAWRADKGEIRTYLQPQLGKVIYDTSKSAAISGHEISGMAALKQEQIIYRQQALATTTALLGEDAGNFPERIPGFLMAGANRESTGRGFVSSMNGGYNTLASLVQYIGASTAALLQKKGNILADTFASSGHKLLNDSAASLEFTKIAQQLRQTPENYALVEGRGLVNIKQLRYEAAIASGEKVPAPVFKDSIAPIVIRLKTEALQDWAREWNRYSKKHMESLTNLRTSQGMNVSDTLIERFYIPPVDARRFPHFAFVVDDSINGTGHISMIHANTADDLRALANKVPTDSGFRVLFKDQSEDWHKAMKNYEYDLGINENYIESTLKRTGVSASTFPVTDSKVLWDELMTWRKNQDSSLVRDILEHRYSPEFAELRSLGRQHDLATNSVKAYKSDITKSSSANPYTDYIKAALYVPSEGNSLVQQTWSAVNRLAENTIDTAVHKLQQTWAEVKSPEDLEKINKMLQSIGVSTYQDAATYALANHTAPKTYLSNWIRKADALLTFTMLKSDPLNAINNGIGHSVLYGTELPNLIKEVMANESAENAAMRNLTHVKVIGTDSHILSPVKIAAKAHEAWWNKIIGGSDGGELYAWAKKNNFLPSYTDQFRNMSEALTLGGAEDVATLDGRMKSAFKSATTFLDEKGGKYSGNNFVEEFNRFRSAITAKLVTDEAIKAGKIPAELQNSIVNTFVNRVEGVHLAAQRPLLFKGAVGQALGLFQTYQFNMLQQMLRHVGDGNVKSVATLLGLQGSIYGMNGLPAFNAMNTYIVGSAFGNSAHSDIISATYDLAGKEGGDWLLYGASSNMLLHPDAKVNLYSRGDINPRQVTIIPTSVADVPIVGATSKFFASAFETVQKVQNGAPMWNAFLQGVEHSGISRPLSGIAQALEATTNPRGKVFSTDNRGNIVMENDLYSAMTAARILGAKPLDEAVALDAFHRVQVYNASSAAKIENLGESIKATVAGGGTMSPEQFNTFASEYAQIGGDQRSFNKFYVRQVQQANRSKVNQMINNSNNFQGRYMQKIMGGYELSDFVNSGEE